LLNARDALSCQAEQRISIEGRHEQGQVLLSICDNGPGIPESLQNKVFDPFFTTKPVGKGTGLGLSVSRQLLEAAGGTISHYSANGYGCCFRVACTAVSKPE
jgi:C4-dicarboxylate-specific signal transduction histidine kinase